MNKRIAIRADASIRIGGGHVMRCLSVASELSRKGYEVTFICRAHTGHIKEFIENRGYDCVLLPRVEVNARVADEWLGCAWEDDAAACAEILKTLGGVEWLFVDHYSLGARWELALQTYCKGILVFDDLADRPHDCDILIDQTFGREKSDYRDLARDDCRILLGPTFAPLRPQFAKAREASLLKRYATKEVKRILVAVGAMDPDNVTLKVLEALYGLDREVIVDVVLSSEAPHLAKVRDLANSRTQVLVNVENMASVMCDADLAIGASGTTSWERCVLGLPALTIVTARNQQYVDRNLVKAGAVRSLGWFEDISQDVIQENVRELCDDRDRLLEMVSKSKMICDGLGANRICHLVSENSR